jgi:hypothetical protein
MAVSGAAVSMAGGPSTSVVVLAATMGATAVVVGLGAVAVGRTMVTIDIGADVGGGVGREVLEVGPCQTRTSMSRTATSTAMMLRARVRLVGRCTLVTVYHGISRHYERLIRPYSQLAPAVGACAARRHTQAP